MPHENRFELEMNGPAIYQIKVKGKLSDHWAEWFNGTLENHQRIFQGQAVTSLIYRVRDQAEMVGIIKQLNTLNLPLISLWLVEDIKDGEGDDGPEI